MQSVNFVLISAIKHSAAKGVSLYIYMQILEGVHISVVSVIKYRVQRNLNLNKRVILGEPPRCCDERSKIFSDEMIVKEH